MVENGRQAGSNRCANMGFLDLVARYLVEITTWFVDTKCEEGAFSHRDSVMR